MELGGVYRGKSKIKHLHVGIEPIGLDSDTLLVVMLPHSRVLRVFARSMFLAMVIVTLPCIGPMIWGPSGSYLNDGHFGGHLDLVDSELLNLVLKDMVDEGLVKRGHKALILSSGAAGLVDDLQVLNDNVVDVVMESDLERQSSISDESYDFVFAPTFENSDFIDRVVKIGGIVVVSLGNYPSNAFHEPWNYDIVYLRHLDSTIVAMRKPGPFNEEVNYSTKRRLCALGSEAKKAALKGLEDALFEPPRRTLAKSNKHLEKFKYLPDLLGDSLEGYRRRIFIDVGMPQENSGGVEWFYENYPRNSQDFEIYNLEIDMEESFSGVPSQLGISDWLMKNVREDEYVVMKAEAEVVEEMIMGKTIYLVDELFFECKNQWRDGEKDHSRRAYWECLALYGRLRDEGVAVHQWWG